MPKSPPSSARKKKRIAFLRIHESEYTKANTPKAKKQRKIHTLIAARDTYAGIGTRKAKLRLNNFAKTDIYVRALRVALEIEDKNLSAKRYYGRIFRSAYSPTYADLNYTVKQERIFELVEICKSQGWRYGIHESDQAGATHVIYFHLPEVEQISWHFTPGDGEQHPVYDGEWDRRENSTLGKLEPAIAKTISE